MHRPYLTRRAGWALTTILVVGGCGLGYIDPETTGRGLTIRIENGATRDIEVSIVAEALNEGDGGGTSGPIDGGGTSGPIDGGTGAKIAPTRAADVRVSAGRVSEGLIACDAIIRVSATAPDTSEPITLGGDGTGTEGFDSGSVGLNGERTLVSGVDFSCEDMVLIRFVDGSPGRIDVVSPGQSFPDPLTPVVDPNVPGDPGVSTPRATFRLENATASQTQVTLTGSDPDSEGGEPVPTAVLVAAGEFTTGSLPCGPTYVVTAAIGGDSGDAVTFSGDGTGTPGFDGGSVGPGGSRLLVSGEHYACTDTIIVRITDDGTGVGLSTSDVPAGVITVFGPEQPPPPPDLPPPPDDGGDGSDPGVVDPAQTPVTINNLTASYVEITFINGTGDGGGDDVRVRVPPSMASSGFADCVQRFVISASHLEAADTSETDGFHTVVLLGAGTGADGFDENNVGVDNTRALRLGTHYDCGDRVTITIDATNNRVDEESGDTIFGVGQGTVTVSSGS